MCLRIYSDDVLTVVLHIPYSDWGHLYSVSERGLYCSLLDIPVNIHVMYTHICMGPFKC